MFSTFLKLFKTFGADKIMKLLPIFSLLSDLMDFIKAAQAEFTGSDSNDAKLKYVVDKFLPLITEAKDDGLIGDQLAEAITHSANDIVSAAVQIMKLIGILHPSKQPNPVPTPVPTPVPSGQVSYASVDEAIPAARALGQFGAVALSSADNRYYAVDGRSVLAPIYTIVWTQ